MIPLIDLRRLHEPCADELRKALDDVLNSGTFVLGLECTRFETAFAAWCGARHALGVGNGAIEIVLRALGIGPSDAVATVANAGAYATTAIVACGATPVFVDVDEVTCNIDVAALGATIAKGVRAVVLTHLYGRLAAPDAVAKLCADEGVYLIEDCAQAHGARLRDRRAGTFGVAGIRTRSASPHKSAKTRASGLLRTCCRPQSSDATAISATACSSQTTCASVIASG